MNLLSRQRILTVLQNGKLELGNIQFSDEMIDHFLDFCILLQKWNEKINLTSEKDALSIFEKHVFDSLQYLRWLDETDKTLDIGSGAGFPGIPAKIIHPDLNLTLIESQRKRCSFMREAIRSLKLNGAQVVEGRAEKFSDQETFSEQFDRVVFRGFSSLETCLAVGLPFLKERGQVILKKGPEEMPDSTHEILPNARIVESKTVDGLEEHSSMMMVIEKCST
jgi:16S rRNA (guanine527-N7)-methyltransferase